MKKWLWIIGIVVIITGIFGYRYFSGQKNKYVFGTVEKRNISELVSETGTIISSGRVEIFSPTNGIISNIFVSNNDKVTERQKLFSVKSTATAQEKAEAFAQYQSAKTALQQAENTRRSTIATVERVHDDVKNHDKDETFVQREERVLAEAANDSAYDALLAAQANLTSAQVKYYATQNSTVTSPISGIISNVSVSKGGSVVINNILSPTTPVLLVNGVGDTELLITVGETDINKIHTGQTAELRFDAVEDKVFHGIVQRYDQNGNSQQGVAKFNVYITVTDADENIKTGMSVDADVLTKELSGVLSVPNTAIKPYQKGRAVRILNGKGQIEYVPVKIGVKGKEYTQILDGLAEGQQFIMSLASETTPKASIFQL